MPEHRRVEVKQGWFTSVMSTRPTKIDTKGSDGLYVESMRIHWWHPLAWYHFGIAFVGGLWRLRVTLKFFGREFVIGAKD